MPKRIAFIYDQELDFGGVETHLLSIFRHIDQNRFSPILLAPVSRRYRDEVLTLGVEIMPIPPFKPLDLSAIRLLTKIFRQQKIDLVHIHSPIAAISARIAARLSGLPAIVTVHAPSTRFYGSRKTFRATAGRLLYVSIDRILNYTLTHRLVYVSQVVFEESLKIRLSPPRLSLVIPNEINLTNSTIKGDALHLRKEYATQPGARVICFAGRLSAEKGIGILLEAVAELLKSPLQEIIKVWILGDGAEKENLITRAKSLGLEGIVQFLGFQNTVSGFLHASDIFVLPSLNEAMSIVLLEAMAAGLPCVVTDVGENSAVVEDGIQGIVIPPNSVQALSTALNRLLTDPVLMKQMGANALLKAQNFDERTMTESLQQLYTEILGD